MKPQKRGAQKEEENNRTALYCQYITCGNWPNLEVREFPGRGRGLVATKSFAAGSAVCHYPGILYKGCEARQIVKTLYGNYQSHYLFEVNNYKGQYYAIDATAEVKSQGQLINHAKHPNLKPSSTFIGGRFHILFIACKDIEKGDELLYDYGQRTDKDGDRYQWLSECPDTCRKCYPNMVYFPGKNAQISQFAYKDQIFYYTIFSRLSP